MSAPEYVETPRERARRKVVEAARALVAASRGLYLSDGEHEEWERRLRAAASDPVEYERLRAELRTVEASRLVERIVGYEIGGEPLPRLKGAVVDLKRIEEEGW